ncbi:MAG TPA: hypothetical protein VIG44_11935 [Thermomicrobiales bacterium]|jgi:hypothetical protein
MADIGTVWSRIEKHAGEPFHQLRGAEFTYTIKGGSVMPNRTNRNIAKSNFEKALSLIPFQGTTEIQHLQGPSYVYAILMDERIRAGEW